MTAATMPRSVVARRSQGWLRGAARGGAVGVVATALFCVGIGLYILTDYQTTIVELRRLRSILPSVWTIRLAFGVPVADAILIGSAGVLVGLQAVLGRWRRSSLDGVMLSFAAVIVTWSLLGFLTRDPSHDSTTDYLFAVRVFAGCLAAYGGTRTLLEFGWTPRQLTAGLVMLCAACVFYSSAKVLVLTKVFGLSVYQASDGAQFWLSDAEHANFFSILLLWTIAQSVAGQRVPRWAVIASVAAAVVLVISTRRGNLVVLLIGAALLARAFASAAQKRRVAQVAVLALPLLLAGPAARVIGSISAKLGSLTDQSNLSTAGYFIGTQNIAANLVRQDAIMFGLGIGRRYEEIIETPIVGASDLAWNEQNQGKWKLTLFTFPYGPLPLYFGLFGTTILSLIGWQAWRYVRAAVRARGTEAPVILALGYLLLFLMSGTSLIRTYAINGVLLALLSAHIDGILRPRLTEER